MTSLRPAVACLSLVLVAAVAPAGAAGKPDLSVAKLTYAKSAVRGAPLSATATVKASGKVTKTTAVGFFLSKDRTKGKSDRALVGGEYAGKVAGGTKSSRAAVMFIPSATKTGRFFLIACADVRKGVKESNERNNCRASKGKVQVRKAGAPVKVSPQLASANAVTQRVGADAGGTVSATGADGSQYTLEIPAGALPADETITMTPVASVGGLPFAGAVAGVDLQPEGLMLLKTARLAITPASPPPAGQLVTVGWHGGGDGLYLEAPRAEKALAFNIDHFSGREVAKGTAAQVAAQAQHPPSAALEQFQQAFYQAVNHAREALNAGNDAEAQRFVDNVVPLFISYYDSTVKPVLLAAKSDDSLLAVALSEASMWQRALAQLSLLGNPGDPGFQALDARQAEVSTLLVTILENALNRAAAKCQTGDLSQIQRLLAIERFAQVLGTTAGDGIAKVRKCLHFELDYDATWQVHQDTADGSSATTDFTTKIAGLKLAARVTRSQQEGEVTQTLQYPSYAFNTGMCHGTLAGADEQRPFKVSALDVTSDLIRDVDSRGRTTFRSGPPNVTMILEPGGRTENVPYTCSSGGGTNHVHYFDEAFKALHASEAQTIGTLDPAPIYTLRDWAAGSGGGVLATKSYEGDPIRGTGTRFQYTYKETSTLRLRHTPEA